MEERVISAVWIIALVVLTIIIAWVWLVPSLQAGRVKFSSTPDKPVSFGPDMAWLAIRTRDTEAVIDALELEDRQIANWSSGIGMVSAEKSDTPFVFVSPPVDGWTFVVGLGLPQPFGQAFADKATPLWKSLGKTFVEVQAYATFPDIDFYAWALMREGKVERIFAINDSGVTLSEGGFTRAERGVGLKLYDLRGVRGRAGDTGAEMILHPTETQVMQLARVWSLDPTRLSELGEDSEVSVGIAGRAPATWKAERIKQA
ncbi:MAG: hypothetical protein ACRBCJ_06315 [Hyphomicrobiaceae bacterium]